MKVGIIGGGFTGLTAAYELLKKGHEVTVFEKEKTWGGLAAAFEIVPGVFLEKFYHHWFTNDKEILGLCDDLGLTKSLNFLPSKTSIFYRGKFHAFDGPVSLLKFSPLGIFDRIRFGLVSLYLKLINNNQAIEKETAAKWTKKYYGEKSYKIIWEPLLRGKFSSFFEQISLTWFWARVKKRTLKLVYPSGGFQILIDRLVDKIKLQGGVLNNDVNIRPTDRINGGCWQITANDETFEFDRLICTSSLKTFIKMFPDLPSEYKQEVDTIKYINAQILILVLKNKLTDYYWTNINERDFPFLALVEQTNFMESKDYGGFHVVYLGNYLPDGDPRLSMSSDELLNLYEPHLKKINREFDLSWVVRAVNFVGPFAQPIVDTGYKEKVPSFETPLKNLYLATMAQVYPWDRGTNYAVKLGQDLVKTYF